MSAPLISQLIFVLFWGFFVDFFLRGANRYAAAAHPGLSIVSITLAVQRDGDIIILRLKRIVTHFVYSFIERDLR